MGNLQAMPREIEDCPDYSPDMCRSAVVDYKDCQQDSFYPFFAHQMQTFEKEKSEELLVNHGDVFMNCAEDGT